MTGDTGRPRIARIDGRRVAIRPFLPREFEAIWAGRLAEGPPPWGPLDRRRLRARVERSGRIARGELFLGIEVDGRLVGEIQVRGGHANFAPPGVFELGISLWEPRDRGHGHGSEAVAVLVSWMFDHGGAERIQATTDLENAAMRRSLEKLGFRFEGVLRGFMPTGSGRADYAMYAVLKHEWPGEVSAGGRHKWKPPEPEGPSGFQHGL